MNFCELGAVSPDYPYMVLLDANAAGWANVMHYWNTADFVRRAVQNIHSMDWRQAGTQRCIAWLFGYTAHLVTDLTIHPIVNLKVGPYAENKTPHRVCEMNQDVYIFTSKNKQQITDAEYVRDCGIASCRNENDARRLDRSVSWLWLRCLTEVPRKNIRMKAGIPGPTGAPAIDKWHRCFVGLIDKFAEEGKRLPPLFRGFAETKGLVYPDFHNLQWTYITDLETPEGKTEHYDAIFDRTQANVIDTWQQLGAALDKGDPTLLTLANGDLDTGAADSDRLVFWEGQV